MKEKKRARGRPPKENPAEKKIMLRVTPEQKSSYVNAAEQSGKSVSAWMKATLDRAAKRVTTVRSG